MMVLRYGDQVIVIDAGLMFPDEELLGIDIMVPDIASLIENASQVKAFLLTHGHEDHIGGLPFVLPALMHVPIYRDPIYAWVSERQAGGTWPA